MGRNRDQNDLMWSMRRGRSLRPAAPSFVPRAYQFTQMAVIMGQAGHVHIEALERPMPSAPGATHRLVARYAGRVAPGTVIDAGGARYRVVRMLAMGTQGRAHFFCVELPPPPPLFPRRRRKAR